MNFVQEQPYFIIINPTKTTTANSQRQTECHSIKGASAIDKELKPKINFPRSSKKDASYIKNPHKPIIRTFTKI